MKQLQNPSVHLPKPGVTLSAGVGVEHTAGPVSVKVGAGAWKIDVFGQATITWKGESDKLFLAPSDESLKAIISALKK